MDTAQWQRLEFEAKTYLRRAQESLDRAEANWLEAGKRLITLKHHHKKYKKPGENWPTYVRAVFNLGRERADELIRIAEERATLAQVREGTRNRVRQSRANQKRVPRDTQKRVLRNTHSSQSDDIDGDDEQPPRNDNGDLVDHNGKVIPIEHFRTVGAQNHLTPEQQQVFETTGSLLAAKRCGFNYEKDKAEEWLSDAEHWADVFHWQAHEAIRLAEECGLLRPGAAPPTAANFALIDQVFAAWQVLVAKLKAAPTRKAS